MHVTFHSIAAGGDAVGRDETGRAVFVAYAAPGDVAEVAIEEERRSFARGKIVQLETPSPQRIEPPCSYYLAGCGGCQLQHLDYNAQLAAKQNIVRDALMRIAKIENPLVHPCEPSPQSFHYRNKGDFVIGVKNGQAEVGFFARNSHDLIDIANCPIQQQPNNEVLAALRGALARGLVTPFDAASGRGVLRRVVARTASNGETLLTTVTTAASWEKADLFCEHMLEALPSLVGILRREPKRPPETLTGRNWLQEDVIGLKLRVSGEGFFQVNTSLTPALVETALRYAAVEPGQRILDLYCGVGLFALAMARAGATIEGIEASRIAVVDAQFNALQNESAAEFTVADAAAGLRRSEGRFDTILLDPPREGAAEAMPELLRLAPHRIVYVSCDPATLARDLKVLTGGGYRFIEATPLDLFPQTAHVETVVLLQKS